MTTLGHFRLLCAHRRGPDGVGAWMHHVERWLRAEVEGFATGDDWYVGQPLIVTENDYSLGLYNGDIGVVVDDGNRMVAAFERGGESPVSPTRLAAVDTVYAMTVHKSQGSQFHTVAFIVPAEGSRLLTRELLYTAVTPRPGAAHPRRRRSVDPHRHRPADLPSFGVGGRPVGRAGPDEDPRGLHSRSHTRTRVYASRQPKALVSRQ